MLLILFFITCLGSYTPKELLQFLNFYRPKSEEHVWEWILRVRCNGGKNIKLDRAGFIGLTEHLMLQPGESESVLKVVTIGTGGRVSRPRLPATQFYVAFIQSSHASVWI